MENSAYRELVLEIYQAVSDPAKWPGVMDRIAETVSANGGMIIEINGREQDQRLQVPLATSNYDVAHAEAYFAKHLDAEIRDHNAFDAQLLETDMIELRSEDILFGLYGSQEEYDRQHHVQVLKRRGIYHRTGALLDHDNPNRARFSLSMSEQRGPFNAAETALIGDILPHLAKALELSRPVGTLGEETRAMLDIFDKFNVGVCLLDHRGCRAAANHEFDRQTEDCGAFSIDGQGRVRFGGAAEQAKFFELLEDAMNHARYGARPRKEAILLDVPHSDTTLCLEVVPLESTEALGTKPLNGALLISRDAAVPVEVDVDLAKQVFDLTAKEAAVVELVSKGLTNGEIAAQRERSVETINAQMKSILSKTRATNRTQLVRLLANFSLPGAYLRR